MNWRPVCFYSICVLVGLTGGLASFGQQPNYAPRKFVRNGDTTEFLDVRPGQDGASRSYQIWPVQIYDLDDDSTTYVMNRQMVLLCTEGQIRNKKREGIFTSYVIDDANHSRRYKIWEQTFVNDKLNGPWRIFSLRGGLVKLQTYKSDSLNGISRTYWIDGKGIMDEKEYFNGQNKFIVRTYFKNGKIEREVPVENGVNNGAGKHYYETGVLQESQEFKQGMPDGRRRYYYPNGQLWIEEVFKAGKTWEVRGSFTSKGQRRKMGTLKNGNGTIIFYNEDGSVRETTTYVNGVARK